MLVLLFVAGDKSLKTIFAQQILVMNGLVFLRVCTELVLGSIFYPINTHYFK